MKAWGQIKEELQRYLYKLATTNLLGIIAFNCILCLWNTLNSCFKQIIPPKEWVPRKEKFDIEKCDLKINDPIEQVVNGNRGIYNCINVHKKAISVKDFYKKATSPKYKTPQMTDLEDVERKYWKNLTFVAPIYGADVPGSITDKDCKVQSFLKGSQNTVGVKLDGLCI